MKYSTTFREQILDRRFDVVVDLDVETREVTTVLSTHHSFAAQAAISISLSNVKKFLSEISEIKRHAHLLDSRSDAESNQKLSCTVGSASITVVHPSDGPPRFAMSIGLFHREGLLDNLALGELDDAVRKADALETIVLNRVSGRPKK